MKNPLHGARMTVVEAGAALAQATALYVQVGKRAIQSLVGGNVFLLGTSKEMGAEMLHDLRELYRSLKANGTLTEPQGFALQFLETETSVNALEAERQGQACVKATMNDDAVTSVNVSDAFSQIGFNAANEA